MPHATIQDALNAVTAGGVVEISNSGRYAETPTINVNAGERVELRAANEHRPTIALGGDLDLPAVDHDEVRGHTRLQHGLGDGEELVAVADGQLEADRAA